jgi:hypothetical protein
MSLGEPLLDPILTRISGATKEGNQARYAARLKTFPDAGWENRTNRKSSITI